MLEPDEIQDTGRRSDKWDEQGGKLGKERQHLLGIVLAAAVIYCICLCLQVKEGVNRVAPRMSASGDFDAVRDFVASYGAYAAVASVPADDLSVSWQRRCRLFFLTLANANLFGWWQGALLSWCSAMAGAAVCFLMRLGSWDGMWRRRLTSKAGTGAD